MANKNSVLRKNSRYVSGGETEVNMRSLEWWERKVFSTSEDDIEYVVERHMQHKIASISAQFLGDPQLWWVIAQYNNILDPVIEIFEGRVLLIPHPNRIDSILDGRVGGIPSARIPLITILPIV